MARVRDELARIVQDGDTVMIGPVRQEVLCGLKDLAQFDRLRDALRAFPDARLSTDDYEGAAAMFNQCRARGIQGSNTDFLICAASVRLELSIFTLDQDFEQYAKVLPIRLYDERRRERSLFIARST